MEKKPSKHGPVGNVSDFGPRKKGDTETLDREAAGAPAVETELKESPKDVPQDVLCPIMSYRASMSTSTTALTALKRPDLSLDIPNPLTLVPVAVPCMQRKCALAVGSNEFGFIGCGLMGPAAFQTDSSVAVAVDRLRERLDVVLSAGPGLAGGMIAMQGAALELKKMLSAVGLMHSEITKQTAAVTKLVNYLVDRLEKPPTPPAPPKGRPPAPPRSPAPPKGNPPIGAVH